MLDNADKLKAIDDVSGEHGRNIGHMTHQYGTDIDMYHFYRFNGAVTGSDNYNELVKNVGDAFLLLSTRSSSAAAQQAFDSVRAWILATRDGMDSLATLNDVSQLLYVLGLATDGMSDGWARDLIMNGAVTRNVNGTDEVLDFGVSTWSQNKVKYRADHHSHVHITLNRSKIGE